MTNLFPLDQDHPMEPRCGEHLGYPAPICGCIECFVALRTELVRHRERIVALEQERAEMINKWNEHEHYPLGFAQSQRVLLGQAEGRIVELEGRWHRAATHDPNIEEVP